MGSMVDEVSGHSPVQSWLTFDVALVGKDDGGM